MTTSPRVAARAARAEGIVAARRPADRRARAAGPRLGDRRRQSLSLSTLVRLRPGDPPPPDAGAGRRGRAPRGRRGAHAGDARCGSNGRTTCCSAAPSCRASCSSEQAMRWSSAFGVNLADHPAGAGSPDDQPAALGPATRPTPALRWTISPAAFAAGLAAGAATGSRRSSHALARSGASARHRALASACRRRAPLQGTVRRARRRRRAAAALGGRLHAVSFTPATCS